MGGQSRHGRQDEVALRSSPPCAIAPFFPVASGSGNGHFVAGKANAGPSSSPLQLPVPDLSYHAVTPPTSSVRRRGRSPP
ncbi:hypothetical protein PVAP13_3KG532850 [Panicum virgatum]|uniref:Uncharacterized protein n=1 Tax=Panicum virgatum TaxID=38727 RepID=A0A8T0V882_PANVG|nr:hypothetical protein PVAP13_3KG532850 [Panicum virgatum]